MLRLISLLGLFLAGLILTGCATTTPALHVIGVYEGQASAAVDDRPWWKKCNDNQQDGADVIPARPTIECHQKYAGQPAEKEVIINVSDTTRPVVLALTAYDKTLWKVELNEGVQLTKVILAGYHAQRISGVSADVPIEVYTYDPSPCDQCWQGQKYFYSYKHPPKQLQEITGLEVTSFQGRYKGSEFSIFSEIKEIE